MSKAKTQSDSDSDSDDENSPSSRSSNCNSSSKTVSGSLEELSLPPAIINRLYPHQKEGVHI